ncbi:MAG TPA: aldo/keto reductase [Novosphingobium sp.]|nr:aldo/keto reductase [Novosphingobium sp.]
MERREPGRSGIRVSAFGLGVMTFGGQTPKADALRQLDMAHDAGITLFDTAENYPTPLCAETQGASERILGEWVRTRGLAGKVVIATKVAGPGKLAAGDIDYIRGPGRRLDRANLRAALDASLARLGVERIDLYQVHWPDRAVSTAGRARFSALPADPDEVPIGETLHALAELVDEGRIGAIGLCNETPWGTMRWPALPQAQGWPRGGSLQNGHSLIHRSLELGLAEVAMREGLGLIGYSPLAAGTLTGKYGTAPAPLPGSRSASSPAMLARMLSPARLAAVQAYAALARAHGLEPAHMALAFAAQQPFMASVLMAASTADQLSANLRAVDLRLPAELVKAINAIHDAQPNPR